jgi:hypothetical protein
MRTCKHKKRLQIYLDGWMEQREADRFEEHLKKCPVCQSELVELEEISSAALEMVDEAPEKSYWDSFYPRLLNRIISRDVTPYEKVESSRKELRLRIGTYSLAIISMAAVILLALNYLPGILNSPVENNVSKDADFNRTEAVVRETGGPMIESAEQTEPSGLKEPEKAAATKDATASGSAGEPSVETALIESDAHMPDFELAKNDAEIQSYFRSRLSAASTELAPAGLKSYTGRESKTDYDKIDKDYHLTSSMISAGMLSDYDNNNETFKATDNQFGSKLFEDGVHSALNSPSGNWGYLSMPPDSVDSAEFRRLLLELELIQTK